MPSGTKADQAPSVLHVITDGTTGAALSGHDEIETVEGTGNTEYSGTVTLNTTRSGSGY